MNNQTDIIFVNISPVLFGNMMNFTLHDIDMNFNI
jgi:hypothetical protein